MSRRGLRPAPGETARQFATRAGRELPAARDPLRELTAYYEHARFSGRSLDPDQVQRAERLLASIEAR
jgi:hypothetical protein